MLKGGVLVFSLKCLPRGKGRPRTTITKAGFVNVYTDENTEAYERGVTLAAIEAMGGAAPLTGPLSVALRFRMPIPKSVTKAQRAAMIAGEVAPTGRPDVDNLVKAVLDGMGTDLKAHRKLKRAGADVAAARVVFVNDAQVTRLFATKIYHERPGVDIRVEAFAPQDREISDVERGTA